MTQLHEYQTPEGFWPYDVDITAQEWLPEAQSACGENYWSSLGRTSKQ